MTIGINDSFSSMSLLGSIMDDVKTWPYVLSGKWDDQLLPGLFYAAHHRVPKDTDEMKSDPDALRPLNNLKAHLRNIIQGIVDDDSRRIEREQAHLKRKMAEKVRAGYKAMNAPAPEGTVKELAQKYGVSLSNVRKLKSEGRLHELTDTHA